MTTNPKTFNVPLKPFDEMVAACKFDLLNTSVSNFKRENVTPGQEVEVHLLPLGLTLNPAILAEIDRLGFRPATLLEMVAVIAANPDILSDVMIVGLGSEWEDSTHTKVFPVVHANTGQRSLSVDYNDESNEWLPNTLFAAVPVRKQ